MAGSEILGERKIAVNPGEEARHQPPAGMDGEADSIRMLADDFEGNAA
jgi:hypothetical protein